jgi:hypothetical protein
VRPQRPQPSRGIVFVARELAGESLRSALAVGKLDAVRLFGVSERGPHGPDADVFDELVQVDNVHNPAQLIEAARRLVEKFGPLEQVVTVQETLLGAAAEVNETLGLRGLSSAAVRRALDKSHLKRVLESAGAGTARGGLITSVIDARRFVDEVGFPIVLKPLNGSGGLATWLIRDNEQLSMALGLIEPTSENTVLAEEYIRGQELCIDTITIDNVPRFHSICFYRPSILEALENPSIQWTCVMPRDNGGDRCREFVEQGLSAVRGLSVGNAVTHMEGILPDGGSPRFTDATLRPAGARIGPMLGFACDTDPYRAWARAAVDGRFDGPWERKYAVGTIFLRGLGSGEVARVEGVEEVSRKLGETLVDSLLPKVGAAKSATYTGDGYMTVRHPETRVVEEALRLIAESVRISYSRPEIPGDEPTPRREQWVSRLGYFDQQLNRPVWDHGPSLGPAGP